MTEERGRVEKRRGRKIGEMKKGFLRIESKWKEDVFILQILFNCPLNFYFVVLVVIGLVGHCCKPQPSLIIFIIRINTKFI